MILIIAYGNDLREDDGAGLLLAEQLEHAWRSRLVDMRRIAVHQLTPELAAEIAQPEVTAVVFVDTRGVPSTSSWERGQPRSQVKVERISAAGPSSPSLGHHLVPGTLLAYAQGLYGRQTPLPAWSVTVPGYRFGYDTRISAATLATIEEAFDEEGAPLRGLIDRLARDVGWCAGQHYHTEDDTLQHAS
jgi:Ni,Fe-hydrogenase maturation factor